MPPRAREAFLVQVNATLTEQAWLSPESQAHGRARSAVLDRLGQHFSRVGLRIYLAGELAVHYPGERVFVPDILAVLEVEDPGDEDERLAWVVAEEGRGLDLVIEILFRGDRAKDLVLNVERYARLGIREYFVFDRGQRVLKGWRLPQTGAATAYRPLPPRFGRLTSQVLGLDLAVQGGRLHFFSGAAELPGSSELVEQLGRMVDEVEAHREQAEQERAKAEQERAKAEQERAKAEQERAKAEQGLEQGLEELRVVVRSLLQARGLELPEQLGAALAAQTDPAVLGRWAIRAATALAAEEVIAPS